MIFHLSERRGIANQGETSLRFPVLVSQEFIKKTLNEHVSSVQDEYDHLLRSYIATHILPLAEEMLSMGDISKKYDDLTSTLSGKLSQLTFR